MDDLKAKFFDDLMPRPQFAEAIGKSERTVARMGLPTAYIGATPYIRVSAARAQILGERTKSKRGRPRKEA